MTQYEMLSEFLSFCGHYDGRNTLKHRLASGVNVGRGPGRADGLGPRGFPLGILSSGLLASGILEEQASPLELSSHLLASPKSLKQGSLRTAESMVIGYDGA